MGKKIGPTSKFPIGQPVDSIDPREQVIDPRERFFMAAQVTAAGRADFIDFGDTLPDVGTDEEALIALCKKTARDHGGTYYIFEVRPVRRITKSTMKLLG